MKARQLIGTVLVFLAAAFTVYLAVIMIRRISGVVLKASYEEIFRYELAACVFFILFALDVRFNFLGNVRSGVLLAAGWILRVLVILVCAVLLFFMVKITAGGLVRTEGQSGHAVVLGLALENGRPTEDLLSRLDTAEAYIQENPEGTLILTGGNPDESGRTEAAVMRDLLLQRGMPEEKMILEDRAETTKENFRNTAGIIDPQEPVVLISSNYHMDRAARTAEEAGFSQILRRPAPSSPVYYGANVMWEVILELNELTLKKD